MSNFICNKCKQQRVKGYVGLKHSCGGVFYRLIQKTANVPMEKRISIKGQGKGHLRPNKSK